MEVHKHPHHVTHKKKWTEYLQQKVWLIIIGTLLCGLPIWFTTYHTYTNTKWILYLPTALIFIFSFFVMLLLKVRAKRIILSQSLGFVLAIVIKIIIDTSIDRTTHNLMPFEIILVFIVAIVSTSIAAALAYLCRLILKK